MQVVHFLSAAYYCCYYYYNREDEVVTCKSEAQIRISKFLMIMFLDSFCSAAFLISPFKFCVVVFEEGYEFVFEAG